MKYIFFILIVLYSSVVSAQESLSSSMVPFRSEFESLANPSSGIFWNAIPSQPAQEESGLRGYTSIDIGTTYFDLQTNASVCKSIFRNDGNGKISAVWNFAPSVDVNFSTRGTGYNFFNGSSWGAFPTARLESYRTGWPNVTWNWASKEFVICHNLDNLQLLFDTRTTAGTGVWTQNLNVLPVPNIYGAWWPRIIRGWNVGKNYLHAIALTLPVSFGGEEYNGIDGALLSHLWDNGECQ